MFYLFDKETLCEIFKRLINCIDFAYNKINRMDIVVSIFSSIVSLIIMIWGVTILKSIKEKKLNATLSFYARFKVFLKVLKSKLGTEEYSPLIYFYDKTIINEKQLTPPDNKQEFIDFINEFLRFIESSDNQIMPSKMFYNNFYLLVDFLVDCLMIGNICQFSIYNENKPLKEKLFKINSIIDGLINEIDCEQNEIHSNIWK